MLARYLGAFWVELEGEVGGEGEEDEGEDHRVKQQDFLQQELHQIPELILFLMNKSYLVRARDVYQGVE